MLPVFNDYISFLESKGISEQLQEGYLWIDNQIIKGFDKEQGNVIKLLRLKIADDLTITSKGYKNTIIDYTKLEPWNDTINRHTEQLAERERESLKLINNSLIKFPLHNPMILTSGGKDSNLVSYLVKKAKPNMISLFNNTSLDCADTYLQMKKEKNTIILNPKIGFYQWIKTNIIPTRFSRGCCRVFKEGETSSYIGNTPTLYFMGMRNEESATRSEYTDEYYNPNWGKNPYQGILPIRKWSELEVWLYTLKNNIDINLKYKKGYSRVGCAIACPFYTKSTWTLDEYWYPSMYKRWQDILRKDFIDNFKWTRLNCTLEEYKLNWNGGLVRPEPNVEVVNEFAEYKNVSADVAIKYFNKNCKCCDKKVKTKDEIAMNLKLLGRNINEYYCKKHLMEFIGIDKVKWNEYVSEFKISGCDLF